MNARQAETTATAIASLPHPVNEADLLALQAERRKLWADFPTIPEHDESAQSELSDRYNKISAVITGADIPTVPAVLIQLQEAMEMSEGCDLPRDTINGLIEKLSGAVGRPVGFTKPDPLVALGAELEAAYAVCYPPGKHGDPTKEEFGEYERIEALIVETPAPTLAGVVVRLRLMLRSLSPNGEGLAYHKPLCRAVIEDIERLGSPSVADLAAEMFRCVNAVNAGALPADEEGALAKKWQPLFDRIVVTPSKNLSDLAAKLRVLEWDAEDGGAIIRAAREDAERLAEGAS